MFWLLLFTLPSGGQDSPSYDPAELLLNVRQKVVATVDRLPRYVCRETVERATIAPNESPNSFSASTSAQSPAASCESLAPQQHATSGSPNHKTHSDRFQIDVAVSGNGEMYSLTGQNRFRAASPAELLGKPISTTGATSTGAFSIFLKTIFAGDAATFSYRRDTTLDGRSLAEFGYQVSLEKGGYTLETSTYDAARGAPVKYSAVVPFDGTFLVDPHTFNLIRLTVHPTHLPKQLRICDTTTVLDYSYLKIGNSEFLLPRNVHLHIDNDDGTQSETDTSFTACRQFGSEFTLRFDTPVPAAPPAPGAPPPRAPSPALSALHQEQLSAIRKSVLQTIRSLPRYVCTETVDRTSLEPKKPLSDPSCAELLTRRSEHSSKLLKHESDRLRLDVAIAPQGEMYSWAGENSFHDRSLADLVGGGVTETGDFSSLLAATFRTGVATFSFAGSKELDGRTLLEVSFQVPLEKSNFVVRNRQFSAVVPYSGTFLVDPATYDLRRMVVRIAELPAALHACRNTSTLDYARVRLNGSQPLLPRGALLEVDYDNGGESQNRTSFSACHEFLGESKLSFDDPSTTRSANVGTPRDAAPIVIPAGIPFKLALTQPVNTRIAAAGDAISASLTTPLVAASGEVVVPRGAPVIARILRIIHLYNNDSLNLVLRLETIESNGVRQPFSARITPARGSIGNRLRPIHVQAGQDLGSFSDLPALEHLALGFIRLVNITDHAVIPKGLKLEGTTIEEKSKQTQVPPGQHLSPLTYK